MAKKKYYAVAVGRKNGIYDDWSSAEKQVKGYPGAKYKSFATRQQAESWLDDPVYDRTPRKAATKQAAAGDDLVPSDGILVYTDGGSINNPGPGGYGIVIIEGDIRRELSGGFRRTTNNRMEMTAAIVALDDLQEKSKTIHLYSDSSYLVNGFIKGWVKKWQGSNWRKSDGQPVLNVDLWQRLAALAGKNVIFHWVKGHAGNEFNERCDQLAVAAARSCPEDVDAGYEEQTG
ncbi:ribonuclease HI [Desulforhopalus singaporensis]|uniref:Ribonuclease H n=1 Tax=Desulforhopalus singaporensis TaxID=91360 RepID=A0A1H0QCA9_9BACT|nr:ribonuclease HI [Desulforhopalus singaporensis]SDP14318.1 RNase HI [Desulforhopalus singaporensis]